MVRYFYSIVVVIILGLFFYSLEPANEFCSSADLFDENNSMTGKVIAVKCESNKHAVWLQTFNPFTRITSRKGVEAVVIDPDLPSMTVYGISVPVRVMGRQYFMTYDDKLLRIRNKKIELLIEFRKIIDGLVEYAGYYDNRVYLFTSAKKLYEFDITSGNIAELYTFSNIKTDEFYSRLYSPHLSIFDNEVLFRFETLQYYEKNQMRIDRFYTGYEFNLAQKNLKVLGTADYSSSSYFTYNKPFQGARQVYTKFDADLKSKRYGLRYSFPLPVELHERLFYFWRSP